MADARDAPLSEMEILELKIDPPEPPDPAWGTKCVTLVSLTQDQAIAINRALDALVAAQRREQAVRKECGFVVSHGLGVSVSLASSILAILDAPAPVGPTKAGDQ